MLDWFSDFFAWMEALPVAWAYVTVLVIAYGENVVPPIPGDMVVVFGGYLAGIGRLDLLWVIVLSTIGGALGFMTMYAIGRRVGTAVTDPDRFQWLPQEGFDKARKWTATYGFGVVAANRFLSGARSVISLTVGIAQMSAWKAAVWCTVSAAVWTTLIAYAGYAVGENWEIIAVYLRAYGRVIIGLFVLAGAALAARWAMRRDKGTSAHDDKPGDH